jgi:hypothetical protein
MILLADWGDPEGMAAIGGLVNRDHVMDDCEPTHRSGGGLALFRLGSRGRSFIVAYCRVAGSRFRHASTT